MARMIFALSLLALSLAFAGDKERNANGPDKAGWSCPDAPHRMNRDVTTLLCRFCKEVVNGVSSSIQACDACATERKVCPVCLGLLEKGKSANGPDMKDADPFVKEGTCEANGMHPGFGDLGTCKSCGIETPSVSKPLCDVCAEKRGVCPSCLKRLPEKEKGPKEARCSCGMRTMDYRGGGHCGACKAEIDLRDKLCGKCAQAAGVCGWCGLKKEAPHLEAPSCKGCPRPEIGPAGYRSPCPACKKPRMARFQRTCDACADAKGICSICGKPKPHREGKIGAQDRREREFQDVPGEYLGIAKSRRCVIREMKDWETLWNEFISRKTPVPPVPNLPNVDLEKEMIIAVFRGDCVNTGYDIRIERIEESDQDIIVYYDEMNPEEGSMHGAMMTQPQHIIRTARSGKPVRFVRRKR